MTTNTYVALDKVTLSSNGGTVTFTNIPQNYTDLCLVINGGYVDNGFAFGIRVGNGSVDTGSNYSFTQVKGNGSVASSSRGSNFTLGLATEQGINNLSNTAIVNFMNYSNTSTFKTWITKGGSAGDNAGATVNLWRSTSAINTIAISESGTGGSGSFNYGNMLSGSTFELYGIRAEGVSPTTKATGGAVYSDDIYYYHVFGASGTFTPTQSITADILVVAGGGGAGSRWGGGGGAGGLLGFTSQSLSATNYTCTVGAGGSGGGGTTTGGIGSVGGDSQFGALTLVKGGGWGLRWLSAQALGAAGTGGSGGGATSTANGTTSSAGAATSGQGFAGGGSSANAAGGGGAGGAGSAGDANKSGNGGIGSSAFSSWGLATGVGQNVSGTYYLAGGGGGGTASSSLPGGTGGLGGGGNGNFGNNTNNPAGNGLSNTGGGGGGAGNNNDSASVYGGNGGSGVIIVRYAK